MIKKLQDNKYFKIAVFIVVLLIPVIYSFFYLKSYWDPYGHLDDITVGIVNLDKGQDNENKGNDFVKELKDSKTFNFALRKDKIKNYKSELRKIKSQYENVYSASKQNEEN